MSEETSPGRRRRILLGISGSVAAVKGPEIALRLARDSGMDVKVILTRGGQSFWEKAKEYNETIWGQMEKYRTDTNSGLVGRGTIELHGTCKHNS